MLIKSKVILPFRKEDAMWCVTEDLVKVGQLVKGCCYYGARSMSNDAQLVFCPYNYINNPVIRAPMEVDIKIIYGFRMSFTNHQLYAIQSIWRTLLVMLAVWIMKMFWIMELQQLSSINAAIYQPLYEMAQGLTSWMEHKKKKLEKCDFHHRVKELSILSFFMPLSIINL
ncbi:Fanconi anemia group J protein homolog [Glycine max]|uniref:Fanconi anemia group J protein homolog n=1 Tax=Glycine max TaxID=3847 RepID=UPI0007191A19|nr:Fanconi anemia group J protein homolog [Glycine max]|eukprot:XP_014619842.1 Fanconi anemia group J protein homolog [Glycine max]